jgi:transposase
MPRPRSIGEAAQARLAELLQQARHKSEFQRVQCVWLRAALGLDPETISRALGWHPVHVRRVQAQYLRAGEAALAGARRGGRRHQNLSLAEEQELLRPFLQEAERGGILVVGPIQAAYEEKVGRRVPKSTVYRLLERHGWRKIAPRPHHPKADPAAQAAFKKTSARS